MLGQRNKILPIVKRFKGQQRFVTSTWSVGVALPAASQIQRCCSTVYRSRLGMYGRMQAFYTIKLPYSVRRQMTRHCIMGIQHRVRCVHYRHV